MPVPITFDFHALFDGVFRNNVGVDGITLGVRGTIEKGQLVLPITGQRFPLTDNKNAAGPWLWFSVHGYEAGEQIALTLVRASDTPEFDAGTTAPHAVK
ncbi:MAG: hypothetical protein WCR59_13370 [Planctomycetota bacterium]|nr:hypothetical protein [Planctomycetota bacterium]